MRTIVFIALLLTTPTFADDKAIEAADPYLYCVRDVAAQLTTPKAKTRDIIVAAKVACSAQSAEYLGLMLKGYAADHDAEGLAYALSSADQVADQVGELSVGQARGAKPVAEPTGMDLGTPFIGSVN